VSGLSAEDALRPRPRTHRRAKSSKRLIGLLETAVESWPLSSHQTTATSATIAEKSSIFWTWRSGAFGSRPGDTPRSDRRRRACVASTARAMLPASNRSALSPVAGCSIEGFRCRYFRDRYEAAATYSGGRSSSCAGPPPTSGGRDSRNVQPAYRDDPDRGRIIADRPTHASQIPESLSRPRGRRLRRQRRAVAIGSGTLERRQH